MPRATISSDATEQSESAWDNAKNTIRRLYLVKDYSLKAVMRKMGRRRFHASKFQYEAHLAKWGFRKNLKKSEWKIVAAIIRERNSQDLPTEVCVDGVPMKTWKVKKALSRYGVDDDVSSLEALLSQLPTGITIRLPTQASPISGLSSESSTPMDSPLADLPSPNHTLYSIERGIPSMAPSRPSATPPYFTALTNRGVTLPNSLILSQSGSSTAFQDFEALDILPGSLGELPFMQFLSTLSGYINSSTDDPGHDDSIAIADFIDRRESFASHNEHIIQEECSETSAPDFQAFVPGSILSKNATSAYSLSLDGNSSHSLNPLSFGLFMISNGLYDLQSSACHTIYHWVSNQTKKGFLGQLLSIHGPTSEALVEKLLSIALEKQDHHMFQALLKASSDYLGPDQFRCRGNYGEGYSLLQRCCELQDEKLIKILLLVGADVNYSDSRWDPPLLLLLDQKDDRAIRRIANIDTVRLLLENGAEVNPGNGSPLGCVAERCQPDQVALLLSNDANPDFSDEDGTLIIKAVESHRPIDDMLHTVRLLIEAGANARSTIIDGELVSPLDRAILEDSVELINLLLKAGASSSPNTLITAIEYGEIEILKILLDHGLEVTTNEIFAAVPLAETTAFDSLLEHCYGDRRSWAMEVGLVAAIRYGKNEIFSRLSTLGVRLRAGRDLELAVEAVSARGDYALLRRLLSIDSIYREAVLNSIGNSLSLSIRSGNQVCFSTLFTAGVDVNPMNSTYGESPLMEALLLKDIDTSQMLLSAGSAVNIERTIRVTQDVRCGTSIFTEYKSREFTSSVLPTAVATGHHALIQQIIDAGAEINAIDYEYGKTALTVAIEKGDMRSVQLLIDAGADVNCREATWEGSAPAIVTAHTPLNAAICRGDISTVQRLLKLGADPDDNSLLSAVSAHPIFIKLILKKKLSLYRRIPRGYGSRALQAAIIASKKDVTAILLSYGIDPSYIVQRSNITPSNEELKELNKNHESAFGTALRLGKDHGLLRTLIEHGADLDKIVETDQNRTALMLAIDHDDSSLVRFLLSAGANQNVAQFGHSHRNPLQRAVEMGSLGLINVLLQGGADVNGAPCIRYGATALQLAASKGFIVIASLLIAKGARINAPPAQIGGRTAIEGAAEHGRIDMIKFLIDAGAKLVGTGRNQYQRACEFALKNGHMSAKRLLETHHAQQMELADILGPEWIDNDDTGYQVIDTSL